MANDDWEFALMMEQLYGYEDQIRPKKSRYLDFDDPPDMPSPEDDEPDIDD
jgi:hypothetical protein